MHQAVGCGSGDVGRVGLGAEHHGEPENSLLDRLARSTRDLLDTLSTITDRKAGAFRRAADASGMSAEEVAALIDHIAVNPMAGIEIPGTGGCRKLRIAGRGKGKLLSMKQE